MCILFGYLSIISRTYTSPGPVMVSLTSLTPWGHIVVTFKGPLHKVPTYKAGLLSQIKYREEERSEQEFEVG